LISLADYFLSLLRLTPLIFSRFLRHAITLPPLLSFDFHFTPLFSLPLTIFAADICTFLRCLLLFRFSPLFSLIISRHYCHWLSPLFRHCHDAFLYHFTRAFTPSCSARF
jgi:hypothetical protein